MLTDLMTMRELSRLLYVPGRNMNIPERRIRAWYQGGLLPCRGSRRTENGSLANLFSLSEARRLARKCMECLSLREVARSIDVEYQTLQGWGVLDGIEPERLKRRFCFTKEQAREIRERCKPFLARMKKGDQQ